MAQEILVKEALSNEMISAGERLARYLDQAPLKIDALLWFYESELNIWRFLIATPEVRTKGPLSVYQRVRELISAFAGEGQLVDFDDIFVRDSRDSLIKLLRNRVRTGNKLSQKRISRNVINGVFIDDVLIYKLV